ncbi:unnamed protein product, partial [Meganyctiphanes norvegica]
IDDITLESLFFADDSILMADSVENAKHNLNILIEVSKKYGLNLNREKCKIIIYNDTENTKEIEGIKVEENVKYLGVTIDNKKDLFKTQREMTKKKAEKYANMTHGIICKSVNRILIGKTYWKCVILPSLLQNIGIIKFNQKEISKLQTIENGVYRKILEGRDNTPISVLRGEIGSSLMETRFIESKLLMAKSIIEGENELTKKILAKVREDRKNTWNNQVNTYLQKIGMNYNEIYTLTK